jgi:hypothetical protein
MHSPGFLSPSYLRLTVNSFWWWHSLMQASLAIARNAYPRLSYCVCSETVFRIAAGWSFPAAARCSGEGSHRSVVSGNYAPSRISSRWKSTRRRLIEAEKRLSAYQPRFGETFAFESELKLKQAELAEIDTSHAAARTSQSTQVLPPEKSASGSPPEFNPYLRSLTSSG